MKLPSPAAVAVLGAAVLAAIVIQFAPLAHFEEDDVPGLPPGSVKAEADAYVWRAKLHVRVDLEEPPIHNETRDSKAWGDDDYDGDEGIRSVRIAGPVLAVGCIAALAAALLALRVPPIAGAVGVAAAVFVAVAASLFASGLDGLFEGRQSWSWGFWLMVATGVLALAGGVLALLGQRRR